MLQQPRPEALLAAFFTIVFLAAFFFLAVRGLLALAFATLFAAPLARLPAFAFRAFAFFALAMTAPDVHARAQRLYGQSKSIHVWSARDCRCYRQKVLKCCRRATSQASRLATEAKHAGS